MAYQGNQPALNYISFAQQTFTIVNSQTAYTLDHSVSNGKDILLYINNVKQIEGSSEAYTASGTTLTLSSALTNGTDTMYCVFIGKAVQTVNPPSGSVGSSQVAASIITGQTALGATPADTDELLISDAGTLKRIDYSYLKSANTPAFLVLMDADQTLTTNTWTKLELDTETYDTDSAFDTSSYKFTVPSGAAGKYLFIYASGSDTLSSSTHAAIRLYKNGSALDLTFSRSYPNSSTGGYPHKSCVLDLAAADYIELYGQHTKGSNSNFQSEYTFLSGHRLIGV